MTEEVEVTSQAIRQLLEAAAVRPPHVRVSGLGRWYIDRRLMNIVNMYPVIEIGGGLRTTLALFVRAGQPDDLLSEVDASLRLGAHWSDALLAFVRFTTSKIATGPHRGA